MGTTQPDSSQEPPGTLSLKINMAEDAAAESPKRKRGRPAKPESEKAAAKKAKTEDGEKRSRGRPKGSKNKTAKKPKGTGKRGRPAKTAAPKEESPAEESTEDAE